MKVAVWDTYVKRQDGLVMHFDMLVSSEETNEEIIIEYGNTYLKNKPFITGKLTTKECTLCHIEQATEMVMEAVKKQGFYILEMENC
jgi:hypothetical protein